MKLVSRLVSVALVLTMLTLNIAAAEPMIYQGEIKNYYGAVSTDLSREAYDAIKTAASEYKDSVSLAAYDISTDEISELYNAVIRDNPSLFYLATSYSYTISGGKVASLLLRYSLPKEQIASAAAKFDALTAAIINSVPAGLDDLGKALYIHDYMATHFEYDLTYSTYDAYSMLETGKGVCQAYTGLYIVLMDKLGVDSSWASSEKGNHTWNVVKLDGKWYHVDVTHDDPISDRFGMVRHNYFLVSDSAILERFPDMKCAFACSDSYYENTEWLNTPSPLAYVGGKWYALYDDGLYTVDIKNGSKTQVVEEYNSWEVWNKPGWYYQSFFSGLVCIDGKLYYNSPTQICCYDPATGKSSEVYTPDTSAGYIYGLIYSGNRTLTYNITTEPGGTPALYTYTLPSNIKLGDVTGDGRVNSGDISIIKRASVGLISLTEDQRKAGDVNGDNRVNSGDILLIKRSIVGLVKLDAND